MNWFVGYEMVADRGKPISEAEAIARTDDRFFNEIFSDSAPLLQVTDEQLSDLVEERFGSN